MRKKCALYTGKYGTQFRYFASHYCTHILCKRDMKQGLTFVNARGAVDHSPGVVQAC